MKSKPLKNTNYRRRLYIMRHGDVSYFDKNNNPVADPNLVELTSLGKRQAMEMGQYLADMEIDKVVCSGLIRTEQTAQLVMQNRDIAIQHDAAFKEIQPSSFESVPFDQREALLAYAFENAVQPDACYGNGEKFTDFALRVQTGFYDLLRADDWSQMLLVAHDGVNRLILALAASNCRASLQDALLNMGGFDQDTCCLNIIDVDVKTDGKKGEILFSRLKMLNFTPQNILKQENHFTSMERVFHPYAKSLVTIPSHTD